MSGPSIASVDVSRGIIIVDTCALFDMSKEIDPRLKANGVTPATYLNMLSYLAARGYRVIIPEMVALEAAQICANGFDIGSLFKENSNAMARRLKPFMQAVAAGELPGMEIMPNTGPNEIDAFCAEANQLHAQPGSRLVKHNDARLLFGKDKKDFGDGAIVSLCKQPDLLRAKNVVVLTSDNRLTMRLRKLSNETQAVRPSVFVNEIGNSDIAPLMGFCDTARGDGLNLALYAGEYNKQGRPKGEFDKEHRVAASRFQLSLKKFAKELPVVTEIAPVETAPVETLPVEDALPYKMDRWGNRVTDYSRMGPSQRGR
ncbi:MAG: hypothetical protein ACOYNL_09490 [Rickettsiales bacterium]